MKIERFNQINESSHNEFLNHYSDDIQKSIILLVKLKNFFIEAEHNDENITDELGELGEKIENRLSVYDKNVPSKIDEWIYDTPTPDEIVEFAIRNQYKWGTEPQMVLYAIEDYATECGIYPDDEDDIDENENEDEFYEGSFQFDKEEVDEPKNENIELFENFETSYTYECSGSPSPTFRVKADFFEFMANHGFKHTTLTKKTNMLIVEDKDMGTLKCQKAQKYGVPIYTYREAKKKVIALAEDMEKYNL